MLQGMRLGRMRLLVLGGGVPGVGGVLWGGTARH